MSRALPEWIGETPDTKIPPRVRLRVFERAAGRCQCCTRKIGPSDSWEADHKVALINGGANREGNLQCLCEWCHKPKTAEDVAEKARSARIRKKAAGIKRTSRPLPGSRASGLRKRMDGTVERWDA